MTKEKYASSSSSRLEPCVWNEEEVAFGVVEDIREMIPRHVPAVVATKVLSLRMARGSQGIGRFLVVFRSISDAASVLDDVDVIVDEASTAFNATQDAEPMYSAWAMRPLRVTKASTSFCPPRNSGSTNDLRLAG